MMNRTQLFADRRPLLHFSVPLILLTFTGASGCWNGNQDEGRPPFSLGEILPDEKVPRARIEVLDPSPQSDLHVKTGQKIKCRVRMTTPDGASLPTFLMAHFKDARGPGEAGSFAITPSSKTDQYYECASEIPAPNLSGKFHLVVEASYGYRTDVEQTDGSKKSKMKEDLKVVASIPVEVRKK